MSVHLLMQIQLRDAIAARLQDERQEIDVLHWMGRAALEIIGQAGLGHSFDSLVEDRGDPYGQAVKAFMCVTHTPLQHSRAELNIAPTSIRSCITGGLSYSYTR